MWAMQTLNYLHPKSRVRIAIAEFLPFSGKKSSVTLYVKTLFKLLTRPLRVEAYG